jgi:hypothetical protein
MSLMTCRRRSQSHKGLFFNLRRLKSKMQAIEDGDLMVATRIRNFWHTRSSSRAAEREGTSSRLHA